MPELPEVETIRRELEREVVGKKVKSVEVTGTRSIRRHKSKKAFVARLDGVKVTGVDRKGKYLLLKLDSGDILVVHLGMSGQLLRAAAKDPVAKHTHVVITFTQGGQLRFVDPRTFGELFVTSPDQLTEEVPELAHMGIDPVEEPMSWVTFGQLLHAHKTKLKAFLMDQSILAGIGNIYSDEILFDAGLRYDRQTDSLSTQEIRRLYRAVVEVLHDAIKYGGSTLADEQYVDLNGKAGEYQEHHQVYDREKQACRRCRSPIVKAKFQNRSTFYCEQCQV
ncbi:MAG: bifunctional DNA-formamidopyrimidine glycosylase/DNA-(apurinic or apyrimidinic site) lyase [Acidimicrobiales bacterium]